MLVNVTKATIAMLECLLLDNPDKHFSIFITACGGARVQEGQDNSLLGHLAGSTEGMYRSYLITS